MTDLGAEIQNNSVIVLFGVKIHTASIWEGIRYQFGRAQLKNLAQNAIHDLNHIKRRILHGKNSCEVFFRDKQKNQFNKRQRKEVFDWIKRKALALLNDESCHANLKQDAVWRIAVKLWLEENHCIRITKTQKVLPNFFDLLSHN